MTWTPEDVKDRLRLLAKVERLLPVRDKGPLGFVCSMPQVVRNRSEYFADTVRTPRPVVTREEITQTEQTHQWLRDYVTPIERKILLAWAFRMPHGQTAAMAEVSRHTLARWRNRALEKICKRINGGNPRDIVAYERFMQK